MHKIDKETLLVKPELYDQQIHSCSICLSMLTFPVSCNTCKTNYCKKCAEKWRNMYNCCPKKCSKPWIFTETESINIQIRCPFNDKCPHSKPQTLQQHLKICEYTPQTFRNHNKLKELNCCLKEHKLSFLIQPKAVKYSICADCGERQICRAICKTCEKIEQKYIYCCKCRTTIHSKDSCPLNHPLFEKFTELNKTYCDKCGIKISTKYNKCYNDEICDYAVCLECIKTMPSEYNQQKSPETTIQIILQTDPKAKEYLLT